jgi:hypothetical protein
MGRIRLTLLPGRKPINGAAGRLDLHMRVSWGVPHVGLNQRLTRILNGHLLVGSTIRWHVREYLFRVEPGGSGTVLPMAGIGAVQPIRSRGGDDRVGSSCPVNSRTSQRLESTQPRPRQAALVSGADSTTAARQNGAGSGADDFGLADLLFPLIMSARAADGRQGAADGGDGDRA